MTNRGPAHSGAFWHNDDKNNDNRSLSVRLVAATQMREIAVGSVDS